MQNDFKSRRHRPAGHRLKLRHPAKKGADEPVSQDTPAMQSEAQPNKKAKRRWPFAVASAALAVVLFVSIWQLVSIQAGYQQAQDEYDGLRSAALGAPASSFAATAPSLLATSDPSQIEEAVLTLDEVMARNSECVGWIEIPGSALSYPVVCGGDNEKYLHTTFLGNQNSAGAIFMDYRNSTDFSSLHTVIYGHNMKNGTMFGSLKKYLDASYMEANPTITLQNLGTLYTYRVFSARVGNMYDDAYRLDFADTADFVDFAILYDAPPDITHMLTLSTCTGGAKDERMLVHAYLERTQPI